MQPTASMQHYRQLNVVALGAMLFLGVSSAVATTPDSKEIQITWSDLQAMVDAHPSLRTQQYEIETARSAVTAAGAVPNPELEAEVGYGKAREGAESRLEWGVSLSIPLDWLGKRDARITAAQASVRVHESAKEALRRDVTLQLHLLFKTLLYQQERIAALRELTVQTDALNKIVQTRVDNGESRAIEAVQIRVEAGKISTELVIAESELKISQQRLAAWMNVAHDVILVAKGDATLLPNSPQSTSSLEKHVLNSPDMNMLQAEVDAAQATIEAEKRERIPEIAVAPFFDSELDKRSVGLGISFALPLWNFNNGNIQVAQGDYQAKKTRLELRRREIESELLSYRTSCDAAIEVAASYEKQILPDAQLVFKTINRTYELGEATLVEVISASRTLIETHLQFLTASLQAQEACSRFVASTGGNFQ